MKSIATNKNYLRQMNIFFLSWITSLCAKYHNNIHLNKMLSEYVQLLSTAHWMCAENDEEKLAQLSSLHQSGLLWKKTHHNHPQAVWTRSYVGNYRWLVRLALAVAQERTARFGTKHKAEIALAWLVSHEPVLPTVPEQNTGMVTGVDVTAPPLCMPDDCKISDDVVDCYRAYYLSDAKSKLRWWRPKTRAIERDDSRDYAPGWLPDTVQLSPPKYFTEKLERLRNPRAKKRKRVEKEQAK